MTEIIYYVAASLDGYIAAPDGGVAWLHEFEGDEDYGYAEFAASLDAVLMGRRTYEQVLTFGPWPYGDTPCWVFSHAELAPAAPEVTITSATPQEVAAELAARGLERAWMVGGAELAAAFRSAGLITEYNVAIMPVILGAGIPLFGAPGQTDRLELIDSTPYASGVVMLRYRYHQPEA